ncbi:MAG: polyamine aminopropyltransferase [Rhodoplanes sp.]|uniref:polyamine aminopropyltransferase n=1 Tax=Rhodoplanes sp. TaxID=1968906 RepID=UPI00184C389D|nr:polyamine aminopropyltransferase [Rhodoplanes sp.]NVO13956.1 polyamine aminopropyltransferase [Rhodoplanes sp.]
MSQKPWIPETLFDTLGFRMSYAAERVLVEDRTAHQHLVLFENATFGKMLMLDGATQVTSRDEFIYHEMMSHVPILAHGAAKTVLIVGGGDCGIAEEVLKHRGVARLVQVEIDAAVVEFAKEHFPEFTGPVLADPRFALVIADGMDFVATTQERFDVVIVDSTDPQGPGAVLFTKNFYAACRRCLTPGGVMVTQNGVPFLQPDELVASVTHFRALFAEGTCYVAAIPTYVGGHMAMGFATDDLALRQTDIATLEARWRAAGAFPTRYWTAEVQRAAFALPRFIAEAISPEAIASVGPASAASIQKSHKDG